MSALPRPGRARPRSDEHVADPAEGRPVGHHPRHRRHLAVGGVGADRQAAARRAFSKTSQRNALRPIALAGDPAVARGPGRSAPDRRCRLKSPWRRLERHGATDHVLGGAAARAQQRWPATRQAALQRGEVGRGAQADAQAVHRRAIHERAPRRGQLDAGAQRRPATRSASSSPDRQPEWGWRCWATGARSARQQHGRASSVRPRQLGAHRVQNVEASPLSIHWVPIGAPKRRRAEGGGPQRARGRGADESRPAGSESRCRRPGREALGEAGDIGDVGRAPARASGGRPSSPTCGP